MNFMLSIDLGNESLSFYVSAIWLRVSAKQHRGNFIVELNQLRGFLGVVREGSFTRAAEHLFLTQPALSLQIKALETELGEQLFERRNRRVYLTEAGAILQEKAESIFGLVSEIHEEMAARQGLQTGQVRIGTSDTICLYLLPSVVQAFRDAYPGIDIHLTNRM